MKRDRPLHPKAEAEIEEAADFYGERDPALAVRFVQAIDHAIDQVVRYPDRHPAYLHGTRRLVIRTFPYAIVCRERDGEVQIVAVTQAKRSPGHWAQRVAEEW